VLPFSLSRVSIIHHPSAICQRLSQLFGENFSPRGGAFPRACRLILYHSFCGSGGFHKRFLF